MCIKLNSEYSIIFTFGTTYVFEKLFMGSSRLLITVTVRFGMSIWSLSFMMSLCIAHELHANGRCHLWSGRGLAPLGLVSEYAALDWVENISQLTDEESYEYYIAVVSVACVIHCSMEELELCPV